MEEQKKEPNQQEQSEEQKQEPSQQEQIEEQKKYAKVLETYME